MSLILLTALTISCARTDTHGNSLARSTPEREGMLTEGILLFLEEMDANNLDIHNLMILRHGKVITEAYWYPYKQSCRHAVHSVSNTLVSTAIGFAIQEKLLTVDEKVSFFFPEYLPNNPSPHLEQLTIKHLLTMSAGQEPTSSTHTNNANPLKTFFATPFAHAPGSKFIYNPANTYILSAVISKVAALNLAEYLQPRLFNPLNIQVQWESDQYGITPGANGLLMRTEDMAKLGQFYLQKGWWNNRQILNKKWVKDATSIHIFQRDSLTYEEEMYDNQLQGYGYQIWRCINNAYRADGADGQFIIILPDEDAVVVLTANTTQTQPLLSAVFKHLQPAMTPLAYAPKPERREQLATAISSLNIPGPFRTIENADTTRNATIAYDLDPNDAHMQQAKFQFDQQGNCLLTITTDSIPQAYTCGLDTWAFTTAPYRPNSPIAGYFSRTSPTELRIRLLDLEEYREETLICRFSQKQIHIEYTTNNPADKNTQLTGRPADTNK